MTPKIEKLKEEKQKNIEKIKGWQKKIANAEERNQVIDRKIIECENTEIIGMIRTSDFTVEEIVELLFSAKAKICLTNNFCKCRILLKDLQMQK